MEPDKGFIGYDGCHFVLVGSRGGDGCVLSAGDVVELFVGGCFQPVRVASGGYRGWYFVLADGQRARFALGMQARGCPVVEVEIRRLNTEFGEGAYAGRLVWGAQIAV